MFTDAIVVTYLSSQFLQIKINKRQYVNSSCNMYIDTPGCKGPELVNTSHDIVLHSPIFTDTRVLLICD